jgi:hypothetical protein
VLDKIMPEWRRRISLCPPHRRADVEANGNTHEIGRSAKMPPTIQESM